MRRQVRVWVDIATDMTDKELDSLAEGTKIAIHEFGGESLKYDDTPEGHAELSRRYSTAIEVQAKGWQKL